MSSRIIILALLLISNCCFAQTGLYYKAVYLKTHLDPTDTTKVLIAQSDLGLFKDLFSGRTVDAFVDSLNQNPFIKGELFETKDAGSFLGLGAIGTFAGGIDVTALANVFSEFLIERAKQELTIAFFNRFKAFSEKNPEFEVLFPKTSSTLKNLLVYAYPQMLPALQSAFIDDLDKVIGKIDQVMALPRYQVLLENFPEIRICLRSIKLVHELETGFTNAADILPAFAAFPEWTDAGSSEGLKNAGCMLKVASILSESIRNDPKQSGRSDLWLSTAELKGLLSDDMLFNIYLSLLYQKFRHDGITYYDKAGKPQLLIDLITTNEGRSTTSLVTFRENVKAFFVLVTAVDGVVHDITKKKASNTPLTNEDYFNYLNTTVDIVEGGVDIVNSYMRKPIGANVFPIVRKANDIYKDAYTKNYAQLFSDVVDEFDLIANAVDSSNKFASLKKSSEIQAYKGAQRKALQQMADMDSRFKTIDEDAVTAIVADEANSNNKVAAAVGHYKLKQLVHFLKELRPYGLFMASAISKDSAVVRAALTNAVLPVGSSSVKKHTNSNLAVQAYLGAYLSNKNNSLSQWTSRFGVIAPIGVSYTPRCLSWGPGGAISVFGSLFDLSAIVDYKLKKDSTVNTDGSTNTNIVVKDYKIKLGQIFSPGLFAVYGFFGNLPLSLGVGGQYGPGLSKINVDNSTVINNPSWRWSVFLAVDIPLFNLHNNRRQ